MSAPIDPVPLSNTAQYVPAQILATYGNFMEVPYVLRGLDTTCVHIAPNGNITHLSGPHAGAEGVRFAQQLQGEQQLSFEQVVTETAFQWGATVERTNYPKRLINCRVVISGLTTYQYQMCDNRWWDGQDETQDGWLGVFTRFTGWRWIPVRPFKTVDTAQPSDPVAYGNNLAIWDINWLSARPWYSKPALYKTWTAQNAKKNQAGYYTGTLVLANQADMQTYVQYIINGEGVAQVQDNNANLMVTLPPIFASDGPCLVDSDPMERTLTASTDPVDNLFYDYLRQSTVLSFLLSNLGSEGEPWWQRGYCRFINSVPPRTVTQLSVAHTNPNASITAIMTQRFKRSR